MKTVLFNTMQETLEQEPCNDAISRKAALDKKWDVPYDGE